MVQTSLNFSVSPFVHLFLLLFIYLFFITNVFSKPSCMSVLQLFVFTKLGSVIRPVLSRSWDLLLNLFHKIIPF